MEPTDFDISVDALKPVKYSNIRQIYQGKRHAVYRAVQVEMNRVVVLKTLINQTPLSLSRLEQEFRLIREHEVPGIVKALSLEHEGERLALVMHDAGKETLTDLIEKCAGDVNAFFPIAISLAQTVENLHKANLIHRDLCPSNIVIDTTTGVITIIDLELATRTHSDQIKTTLVRPGRIDGSLPYISPEQTGRIDCVVDYRTDLYSLGAIFYELLTGSQPFVHSDPLAIVHAHLSSAPVPPHIVKSEIPNALSAVVLKLMSKVPEDRYQSASGLMHDLDYLSENIKKPYINFFIPGRRDLPKQIAIPDKLYGRDDELQKLGADFDRMITDGRTQCLLVGGYSGVGKTAFVHKLYEPLARKRGFFISGKLDQISRDIPFGTITQAIQNLVQYLLTESEEQIAYWREQLEEEVGAGLAFITRLVPKIELLLGNQDRNYDCPPQEMKRHCNDALRKFIKVFARADHPLVLFLDDLQWADLDTLGLVKNLIADGAGLHLLIIGSYRDNEITADRLFELIQSESHDSASAIQQIVLKPLTSDALNELVKDTLRCELSAAEPLSNLIYQKTHGNPLFATQFLQRLYQDELLQYNLKHNFWHWDMNELQAQNFADNIVGLLLEKLQRLPKATRHLLQLASCLGNCADIKKLALIARKSESELFENLLPAAREGLVSVRDGFCRFLHDKVQQAAYEQIDSSRRESEHLVIGRRLLKHATKNNELEESIFDVVSHFGFGARITSASEKAKVANLNLLAGRKALNTAAYQSAKQFFYTGLELLNEICDRKDRTLLFNLRFELANCLWLVDEAEQVECLFVSLLSLADSPLQKAMIHRRLAEVCTSKAHHKRAAERSVQGLAELGMDVPLHPSDAEVANEYDAVWKNIGDRRIEELIDLPMMTDANMSMAAAILQSACPSATAVDFNFYLLICARSVNISLLYGNCDSSLLAYTHFGSRCQECSTDARTQNSL